MGEIHVHEFMTFDGVINAPTWSFDYGFDPKMGEAIGAFADKAKGILLGRTTFEMFEDGDAPAKLERVGIETYDNGVFYVSYRPQ